MDAQVKVTENKKYLTRIGSDWGGLHLDMSLIPDKSLIVSAGLADDISFDLDLIEKKECYVIGIDPTQLSANTIAKFQRTNRSQKDHFQLLRKAVHGKSELEISLGGPANTFLSPIGEKATTISLDDLILMYAGASVIKLDIEGAEFPAIECLDVKIRVPQLAIGFHVWLNSESDQCPNEGVPPHIYTANDVLEAVQKIKRMGYKLVFEYREHEERIGQETLFVRADLAANYHDIEL